MNNEILKKEETFVSGNAQEKTRISVKNKATANLKTSANDDN